MQQTFENLKNHVECYVFLAIYHEISRVLIERRKIFVYQNRQT